MKRQLLIISLMAILLMTQVAVIGADDKKPSQPVNVKGLMNKFLGYMVALKPYIASEQKMNDPQNDADIRKQLKGLAETVKDSRHESALDGVTLKISRDVLENHVAEIERVYRLGNKNHARWMLQTTLSVCMSCHTQLPAKSRSFEGLMADEKYMTSFEQAEFLFAIRDFDRAHDMYDKAIKAYPGSRISTINLEDSFERQVAYYARIKRNPTAGRDYLDKTLKSKKFPQHVQKNVEAWKALFHEWSKEKAPDLKAMTDVELKKYVTAAFKTELWDKMIDADNPRVMTFLKISGLLYEYLSLHPNTSIMPDILYWLARCDRALNNNFFYSLADMYLRECVVKYPQSATAVKCFDEYESSTIAGYTGSAGVNVPEDVLSDINKLKSLIQKEKK